MKTPHLLSAVAALLLAIIAIAIGDAYAQSIEGQEVYALAPQWWEIKPYGLTVNQLAMQRSDLLPVYGASELHQGGQFTPINFFSKDPTGFRVFPIGGTAHPLFNTIIEMAAQGAALNGKSIVISVTPSDFSYSGVTSKGIAPFYSAVYANEMIFNSPINHDLKAQISGLMLQYSTVFSNDLVLNFALNRLAGSGPLDPIGYAASVPLGKLQTLIGRLQSDWAMLDDINQRHHLKPGVLSPPQSINWPQLLAAASLKQNSISTNNFLGLPNAYWLQNEGLILNAKNIFSDTRFMRALQTAQQWQYLARVLDVAHQLGAKPLIVSMPFDGLFGDFRGISAPTRATFYAHLSAVAESFQVPLVDFASHEYDTLFFNDVQDHPSPRGQLYYDWVINAFYHQTLVQPNGTLLNPDTVLSGDHSKPDSLVR
jgi:D-alanine transfer protein